MLSYTAMTMKEILTHTDGCTDRCPHCRCWSVRIPKDGTDPLCVNDRCSKGWVQDPELRAGRPKLTVVEDPDAR